MDQIKKKNYRIFIYIQRTLGLTCFAHFWEQNIFFKKSISAITPYGPLTPC